jgi:DNA ligase (NAD+)
MDVKAKIDFLRQEIARCNDLYYNQTAPTISDYDYDQMVKELEALEKAHPEYASETSPTLKVGKDRTSGFKTVKHSVPMMSLSNTYNKEDVEAFIRRLHGKLPDLHTIPNAFVIEPKVDGVSISLTYIHGRFVRAVTRGDGTEGDDVTANVRTIEGIPEDLRGMDMPGHIEVRGEIYIDKHDFEGMNKWRVKAGFPPMANARNAAAGSLKLLDAEDAADRPLKAVFYGFGKTPQGFVQTQEQVREWLSDNGFPHFAWIWVSDAGGVWNSIEEIGKVKDSWSYPVDGAVVKLNSVSDRSTIGSTTKAPGWAMAYKYAETEVTTKLVGITVQVGRTGVLTPVAELQPVNVCGSVISRATLHNEDEIKRLDVRIGDTVVIKKAGEVIPAVVRVEEDLRPSDAVKFDMLEFLNHRCPCCQGPIEKDPDLVAWKCKNLQCPAQLACRLVHFGSRHALDLTLLGTAVAEALIDAGLVKHPLDVYQLTLDQLATLPVGGKVFGTSHATTLYQAIQASKTKPLSKWIYALGIPNVGITTAQELAQYHGTIPTLATSAILLTMEQFYQTKATLPKKREDFDGWRRGLDYMQQVGQTLSKVKLATLSTGPSPTWLMKFGEVVVQSVLRYFESSDGQFVLQKLAVYQIVPSQDPSPVTEDRLTGKTFLVTGAFALPRSEMNSLIESYGGKLVSSVSSNLDYLVVGKDPSQAKVDKAKTLGITILDRQALIELLLLDALVVKF